MLFDLNLHRWTLPSVRLDFLTALGLDQISQLKIDNETNVSLMKSVTAHRKVAMRIKDPENKTGYPMQTPR